MRTKKAPILTALAVSFIFASGIFSASEAVPPQSHDKQERGIRIKNVKEFPDKAKRFALVIGIDQYNDPQINRLDGASNDAKAIAEALVNYSGFPQDQVILLSAGQAQNLQPTRVNILRRLSNLTSSSVPKDGLLLLFFAGHGIEKEGHAFLLPTDAEVSSDLNLLEDTAIPVERINGMIRQSGIQQIILILDACRNSPEVGRGEAGQKLTKTYTKNFDFETKNSEITAFATLYASELGQTAYEYKEKKHGYFTWALIEAIKGGAANEQGEVTLSNLRKYIQETVPKRVSMDLGAGKHQRPFAEIKGYKAEELVFAWVKPTEDKNVSNIITVAPAAKDLVFWESIKDSNNPDLYQAYLDRFPDGEFVPIAKDRLAKLQNQQPKVTQPQATANNPKPQLPLEKNGDQQPTPAQPQLAKDAKGKKSTAKSKPSEIPKTRTSLEEIGKQPDKPILKDSPTTNANPNQTATHIPDLKDAINDGVKQHQPLPNAEKLKQQNGKEEKILWDAIADSMNLEDYKMFLTSFPKGAYAAKALTKIAELTELADWNEVKESLKKNDIKSFLEKYPKGAFAKLAIARLGRIDEEVYWNSIKDSKGIDNFKTYLVLYPKGFYVEVAKIRVKELSPTSKPKTERSPSAENKPIEANLSIPPAPDKQPDATASVKKPEAPNLGNSEIKTYIENFEKFIREKKWNEAIEVINRAIKLEPKKAEWHYRLGALLIERKKWHEAEIELITTIQIEATNARWRNAFGLFLSTRDRHIEAIGACKKATELEPDNAKFHADLSQTLLNQYDIEQSALYDLKGNPGLRNRLKRMDESGVLAAEIEVRKAISLEPNNPSWHMQLSKVLIWLDKWKDAEFEVRQALHFNPLNSQEHNQLGLILLVQEKFQEAEAAFREALRLEPSNSIYKANLKKALQK